MLSLALTSFVSHFSLIYEMRSSIFSRNKSGPSSGNSTATRVPLYKLTSIIIIPLVRRSGSLHIFLAYPAICLDPFTWFSVSWPLATLHAHDCTSAQSFATVNDIRIPALPMYLVQHYRDPCISSRLFSISLLYFSMLFLNLIIYWNFPGWIRKYF